MREKYESLALSELREIAKARGLKGISALKKADLIEHMLAADEKDKADGKDVEPKPVLKGIGERPSHERREGGERREFRREKPQQADGEKQEGYPTELDSGLTARGILEVMADGFGFIRSENFLPGENDVYVAPSQIRRFNLRTGDIIEGNTRIKTMNEKFSALLYLKKINGYPPEIALRRRNFEDMTPIFPNERIRLETGKSSIAMRIMDLMRDRKSVV